MCLIQLVIYLDTARFNKKTISCIAAGNVLTSLTNTMTTPDNEDECRTRRRRGVISYKEPSLNRWPRLCFESTCGCDPALVSFKKKKRKLLWVLIQLFSLSLFFFLTKTAKSDEETNLQTQSSWAHQCLKTRRRNTRMHLNRCRAHLLWTNNFLWFIHMWY